MKTPLISIVIPVYNMANTKFFLKRALDSIATQTYKDIEVVMPDNSHHFTRTTIDKMLKDYDFNINRIQNNEIGMAVNTNLGLKQAKGDLIKILFMDDYLAHEDSIKTIVKKFKGEWLVTGCAHDPGTHTHEPTYNDQIHTGVNTIGSPSVLTLKAGLQMYFDEEMTWLLDCDLYRRLHDEYGKPTILNDINVVIGVGEHQTTHIIGQDIKEGEHKYMINKYDSST